MTPKLKVKVITTARKENAFITKHEIGINKFLDSLEPTENEAPYIKVVSTTISSRHIFTTIVHPKNVKIRK